MANRLLFGKKAQQNIGWTLNNLKKEIASSPMANRNDIMKTTPTKNKVIDYLQWTTGEYEKYLIELMFDWCKEHGRYPSMVQQLFANAQINAWFLIEFEKRENSCIAAIEATHFSLEQTRTFYRLSMNLMLNIYPTALMEDISRNRDFSNTIMNPNLTYYAN